MDIFKKKVIFLDRDGTLNKDFGYTHKIEDYELLPGVKEGLKLLQEAGFNLVILTSQSGIGRGMYGEEDYRRFMSHLLDDLKQSGVEIMATYFCPHHAEHGRGDYKIDCDCRKPKPGLILQAQEEHGPFAYERSWSIGDAARDIQMAKNAHPAIRGVILPKNYGTDSVKPLDQSGEVDFTARNFLEAVDIILNNKG